MDINKLTKNMLSLVVAGGAGLASAQFGGFEDLDLNDLASSRTQEEVEYLLTQDPCQLEVTMDDTICVRSFNQLKEIVSNSEENEEECQITLTQKNYRGVFVEGREPRETTSVCLDQTEEENIEEIIFEMAITACISPFCGCWLG